MGILRREAQVMSEDWKRSEEMAAVFGVSVRRVQQLVQEGIIKAE